MGQPQANRRLVQDQYDLSDDSGAMCEVLGHVTGLPHFSTSEGAPEGDVYGVSVGWLNRMAGARCPAGEGACLWQHAKWTPYGFSIDSEDFAGERRRCGLRQGLCRRACRRESNSPPFSAHVRAAQSGWRTCAPS